MATQSKLSKFVDCYGPDSVFAVGNFTTAGTGAVVTNEAQGFTVSRTNVGEFTIVFARGWKALTITFGLQHTTQAATPTITSVTPSTRTVIIKMLAGSTATETTGATIHVQALLRKSI
jgi:hypothetical protein